MAEKKDLSVVRVKQNFDAIKERLVRHVVGNIESFDIGQKTPKMMTRLMREVALGVEQYFKESSATYINEKIEAQISAYVGLNMPALCGMTEEGFRRSLESLAECIREYFAPPAVHPIIDGEFTFLIVIPIEWVSLRAQIGLLCGPNTLSDREFRLVSTDTSIKSPVKPYALVGINGGRRLRDQDLDQARAFFSEQKLSPLKLHEIIQLFLMKPEFLSDEEGIHATQSEAYALGERCGDDLIRLTAQKDIRSIGFRDPKTVTGVGIGKPFYSDMITSD